MALSDSILTKLSALGDRFDELARLLSDPDVMNDRDKFTSYSKEYAELEPVVAGHRDWQNMQEELTESRTMANDDDPEMRDLANEEIQRIEQALVGKEDGLLRLLIPKDPNDKANVFLEIRAGTGGDEAAIFSGDLFRMYMKFAEGKGWRVEVVNERAGEHGGYKEIISRVVGSDVYSQLKFESGAHRVQRVPETESQGRIHTSACTVAILPEAEEVDDVDINKADLRVDTFRASGAGGQHVNKTDSAVRLTHIPSGIVVECQDERSQHKNRARAMSLLKAKLLDSAIAEQQSEQAESRKLLVGSGDRSERVRTYNYPQGRITDHRINLTLYKLPEVLEGALENLIDPLVQEHQADQLRDLGKDDE